MSDEPENLVLRYLRRIDLRGDAMDHKLDEVVGRLTRLELLFAGLRRDQANDAESAAYLSARTDKIKERINRIERRLDLVDQPESGAQD
jgi:hypothetical protein